MNALNFKRSLRALTLIAPAFGLAACLGTGDGADPIAGTPATEAPTVPAGFCGPINFEVLCDLPGILNFNGGVSTVIDNPSKTGINTSDKVAQMIKRAEEVFGGTRLNLSANVDFSQGESFKVKVRSPRSVPLTFKLEHVDGPASGVERVLTHSGDNTWQELCFDFSGATAGLPSPAYTLIFDNNVLGQFDTNPADWTFQYDDIVQVQSCAGAADNGVEPSAGIFVTDGEAQFASPRDYTEVTAFGSGSVIDTMYSEDSTYSPAVSVFSGAGYGPQVAQIGLVGFRSGFAGAFETLNFKVKGVNETAVQTSGVAGQRSLPSQVVIIKFIEDGGTLRINLTSSAFAAALENDWFQVSVPVSRFRGATTATGFVIESDDSSESQFRMLLADLGFSGTGSNPPGQAGTGIIPEQVVYATDPDVVENLAPAGFDNFGSGAVFNGEFFGDGDFRPAFQVTSGEGYGEGQHVGFVAFTGYDAGFASSYGELNFKVKADAANLTAFEVKFFAPDTTNTYDLTTYPGAADLGNGWLQVTIPMSDFGANIDVNDGFLVGPLGPQAAAFSYLLTDIGFSGEAAADPGITPEAVVYASDPNVNEDLAPAGLDNFGSGAMFDTAFAGDEDFIPAIQVTSGEGYGEGAHTGFVAFTGYAAGFASRYTHFNFKVKADTANITAFEVKFFAPDTSQTYDLTAYEGVTDLGKGWLQVTIPMADFAENINDNDGFLVGPLGAQAAAFSYLLTDIGFSGELPADAGITPDAVVYATDPAVMEDLAPAGVDNFGSGAVFDGSFASDADFNPAFQVTSGEGYGEGAHTGFVAFTGYDAGFASSFTELNFKIKADTANITAFEVKFFAPDTSRTYDLTTYEGVTDLGRGWLQVTIPMSDFADNINVNDGFLIGPLGAQAAAFSYLLTDIGFSGMAAADPGITPDAVVYASDPNVNEDSAPGGIDNFGSGATFNGEFDGDNDFSPAFQVTSGEGYGDGVHVGFVAFTGYSAGFAAGFAELNFKVKADAANLAAFEVKFFAPDTSRTYDLTTYPGVTELGNGWLQVTIPMSDFAENIDANDGFLVGPLGGQAEAFNYLLTDIGFSGQAAADSGITPDSVVYATDPGVTEDLAPAGIDNFGSGAVFDGEFAGDADFNPAFQITSGEGYGDGVHAGFVAFTGYSAGFAAGFSELNFKIKADAANLAAFEVKFFAPDVSQTYDLTTYPGVSDLGNGWLQVTIPMSDFAASIDVNEGFLIGPLGGQAAAFSYLVTDIGFSGSAPADAGITPANVVYASNPDVSENLAPAGFDNFGSGAAFDGEFTGDSDFSPAFKVTSGEGYGDGVHVGFVAFTGYSAGFASGFTNLHFKIKADAANITAFEVKFFAPDTTRTYDLTTYSGVTALGNGWLQVTIPVSDFAENIAANDGFLIGPLGGQASAFEYLLTDIGFDDAAAENASITPEAVVYATDPNVMEGLAPAGFDNFGSGATFEGNFTGDADFNPAFQVTSGEGYGADVHVGFVAFTGYSAGFAAGFETLHFKIKADAVNLTAFEVKFFAPDTTQTYNLTTYEGVADLGNGWLQVSIPMSDFAGNIAANDGFLIGPLGGQPAAFSYLITDIGFSGGGG